MKSSLNSITLLGMSGVGKTHLALRMAAWGWEHYSCDLEIGTRFLGEHMDVAVRADDLSPLSRFIGKLGAPEKGGLNLEEFKTRQKLYYDAEMAALYDSVERASQCDKFVNDSTGSLCEIDNPDLFEKLGNATTFVYIEANDDERCEVLKRAQDYPKPLFFPPEHFDIWLEAYLQGRSAAEIDPDDFARWVFPRLFEARLPKYRRLAQQYGVIVSSADLRDVANEEELLSIIRAAK